MAEEDAVEVVTDAVETGRAFDALPWPGLRLRSSAAALERVDREVRAFAVDAAGRRHPRAPMACDFATTHVEVAHLRRRCEQMGLACTRGGGSCGAPVVFAPRAWRRPAAAEFARVRETVDLAACACCGDAVPTPRALYSAGLVEIVCRACAREHACVHDHAVRPLVSDDEDEDEAASR